MTPATIWARVTATVAAVAVVVILLPPEPLIVVVRVVGLLVALDLILWYHRHADWASSRVGRGTMAIKAGVAAVAAAANVRTLDTHILDDVNLDAIENRTIAGAWILLVLALILRRYYMRRLWESGDPHHAEPVPRKEQP